MEVKIGVQNTPREIVIESAQNPNEVQQIVADALRDQSPLILTDEKGRLVVVPITCLAYVEIAEATPRRVGFGS